MFKNLMLASAAAMGLRSESNVRRIYGDQNIKRYLQRQKRDHARGASTSIAQLNRHTGEPHEHRREIARHLRQAR